MVISWPRRIKPDKTPRPQFLHVNDVVATLYEILGINACAFAAMLDDHGPPLLVQPPLVERGRVA